jgi:hypothetical protein
VTDAGPFEEKLSHKDDIFPDFSKRRRVKWIRGVDKTDLNPNLFKLLLNQQAIVDASAYSQWIDALLYEFFNKGGEFHYVLRVGTSHHIRAQQLFGACVELFKLVDEFAATEGIESGIEDVETRINLNSPGDVELWRMGVVAAGLVALMIVAINGGGLEFQIKKYDLKFSLKTEGLLKRLTEFLNAKQNRTLVEDVRKKLDNLKVETPKQVIDLIKNTRNK